MNPDYSINQLKEIFVEYFKNKPVVIKAYLFGSYARNQADEKSDMDILVDLEYKTGIAQEYVRMVKELKVKLNKDIHLITTNSISPFIEENINKDKILLYER